MIYGIKKCVITWLLLLSALNLPVYGTISVKVFSKEEALTEVNISRPRIYIQNTGTDAISNVTYYYYFSTEDNKIPVPDLYYVNGHTVIMEAMGNSLYRISYTISGTISPGQTFPDASGIVIGIHYNDWSNWDKSNDYSQNNSLSFVENSKIAVYINNVRVHGTEPVTGGDDGGNDSLVPPQLTPQLLSFALFSTDSSIVKERSIFSGGGAVGSNNFTKIGIDAIIYGNVVSGGDATLMQKAKIYGDVKVSGVVTTDLGVSVTGEIQQGIDVGTISLPSRSITPGSENIPVGQNGTRTLAPGIYGELSVDRYGTITLLKGNYVFKKIYLETDAHIIFNTKFNEQTSIDVSGDVKFSDRSTVTFSDNSYSPSVQIFTNDSDEISIGTNVIMSGILVAPYANVIVYSNAQCNGAIYAKAITLEPDSRVMSLMVDPNGDADGDKVPNYVEIHTGTDPTKPDEFIPVAIPVESMIDNRVTNTVKYTLNDFFDDYNNDDTLTATFPAGSLKDPFVPVFFTVKDVMTSYTGDDGYVPVSRTVGVIGDPVNNGREVTITMPVSQNSLPGDYAIMQTGDVGPVLLAAEPSDGGITFKLSNAADFTIVKKVKKVTGYFDNGIVYSNEKVARVTLDIAITDCKTTAANPGTAVLTYTDYSDPQKQEIIPQTIDLVQKGDGLVTGTGDFMSKKIGGAIEITALEIKIPSDNLDAKTTCSYMVKPGQWFKVSAGKTEAAYNNAQTAVPDKYVFSYVGTNLGFESASLNGEGVARKNPGAVNDVFRYSYFYKDHLGTTRMVVNEDNGIAEAMMYQAYGTYSDVFDLPSADPLREKFTGKEFDEEGAVTESEITLDIKITGFPNTDGYSNVLTVTCQNMVTGNDVVKSWLFYRDETSLWLYRNDRFPDNMKLKKIEIKANGTSQTIDYSKSDFNIQVDCGKKLTVALNKSAQDIISNNNANHFTVTGPEVVTDQVAGLGLYYFGARYLDAEIGTWLSRDAVEQYMNSYMYSGCNPINLIDPNGLQDVYINRDDKPFIYEWPETIDLGLNINTIYIDDYSTFTNMGLSLNMDYLNSTVFDISSFNDFQYSSIMAYNSEFYKGQLAYLYVSSLAMCMPPLGLAMNLGGIGLNTYYGDYGFAALNGINALLSTASVVSAISNITSAATENTITLYRGINETNKIAYNNAFNGIVKPNKNWYQFWRSEATTFEHNAGSTLNSSKTSWTSDVRVAQNFASRPGGNGIVLETTIKNSRIIQSPNLNYVLVDGQIVSESEVLLRGIIKAQIRGLVNGR